MKLQATCTNTASGARHFAFAFCVLAEPSE
jgi:hypothetical protein